MGVNQSAVYGATLNICVHPFGASVAVRRWRRGMTHGCNAFSRHPIQYRSELAGRLVNGFVIAVVSKQPLRIHSRSSVPACFVSKSLRIIVPPTTSVVRPQSASAARSRCTVVSCALKSALKSKPPSAVYRCALPLRWLAALSVKAAWFSSEYRFPVESAP